MSAPVITVNAAVLQDNTQRIQRFIGTLTIGTASATYPAGGIPIQAVLAAALSPASSSGPVTLALISTLGSGYIYTYIPSTGKVQILQTPASGSLTTAAPLSQLGSGANSLSGVAADVIAFDVCYEKNT
jgi:hypothetical protein